MKQYKGYERKEQIDYMALPKGAYVLKILDVKEVENKNKTGSYLKIAFDIAEGEYKGFYKNIFDHDTREDKKWNNDGCIYMTCPTDESEQFVIDNFNKFVTAVEDSNKDYHWDWKESSLKNKLVGAKFCIEQSEYDGKIYSHTKAKWFVAAQKIRDGKYGQLPNDKLITASDPNNFINVPESVDEECPFL